MDRTQQSLSISLSALLVALGISLATSSSFQSPVVAMFEKKQSPAPVITALAPAPAKPETVQPPAAQAEASQTAGAQAAATAEPQSAPPGARPLPAPPEAIAPAVQAKAAPAAEAAAPVKPDSTPAKEPKPAAEPKIGTPQQLAALSPPAMPEDLEATGAVSPSAKTPVDGHARSYEAFARDIEKLDRTELKTPKDVKGAFDQLLKHQPEKLAEGWIAYSARIVAQNEKFASAIAEEVEKRGRDTVMDKIVRDPKYVNKLPGAYEALDGLMKQLARDTSKLARLGDRFIQTAYAFQKKKWGEADILPRPRYASETARVIPAGLFSRDEAPAAPVGVTQRVLLLAASLDAGGPDAPASKELMHDPSLAQCMRWARLNLNQCLAAAYFPSEQAYCTGKHAINEVNACWTKLLPSKS